MPRQVLATAFLNDGGNPNRSFTTYPGGRIEFRGNAASVVDERDMVHVLTMPNVVVDVSPERVEWLPEWASKAWPRSIAAKINVPSGWELTQDGNELIVFRAEPMTEVLAEPEPVLPAHTWKPRIKKVSGEDSEPVSS